MKWTLHHNTNQSTVPASRQHSVHSSFLHGVGLFRLIEISYWTKIKQTINHANHSFDEFIFLCYYKLYNLYFILHFVVDAPNETNCNKAKWNEMMSDTINTELICHWGKIRQIVGNINFISIDRFECHSPVIIHQSCYANGCQTLHTDFQIPIIFVFAFHLVVKKKKRFSEMWDGEHCCVQWQILIRGHSFPMIANIITKYRTIQS